MKKPKAEVRPIVIIVERDGDNREYEFKQDSIIVGSGPTTNLTFTDDSVSSLHAIIKLTMEAATLVDLGSETGTFVNGKRVKEVELKDGDTIRVGKRQFVTQLPPVPLVAADDSKPDRSAVQSLEYEKTVQNREPTVAFRAKLEEPVTDDAIAKKPGINKPVANKSLPNRPTAKPETKPERKPVVSALPVTERATIATPAAASKSPTVNRVARSAMPMEPTDVLPRARDRLPDLEGQLVGVALDARGFPESIWRRTSDVTGQPTATAKTLEVAVYWGDELLEVRHFDEMRDVSIGHGREATIQVAADTVAVIPLIRAVADMVDVVFPDQASAEIRIGDKIIDEVELKRRKLLKPSESSATGAPVSVYRLGLGDLVAMRFGSLTVAIRYVHPAPVMKSRWSERLDQVFVGTVLYVALFALFSAVMITLAPVNEDVQQEDLFKNAARFAKLILTDKKAPQKKFELSGAKAGGHHRDDDGRFGKKDVKKDAAASAKGAAHVDANKRENDRKIALNSGILGALKGGKASAMSNVFGPGGLGTGISSALGGLHGQQMSDAGGLSGLGSRGSGPGAAGSSVGIGGLGKNGGSGDSGAGNIDLGGRGKSEHAVEHGQTIVQGALSQDAIARVLSRAQSQMRYCYEKEMQRIPDLNGKITVKFTIGGTGTVTDANVILTTMNNSNVEECLSRVFKRLRFPEPAGGGEVDVTYPLVYNPTGAN